MLRSDPVLDRADRRIASELPRRALPLTRDLPERHSREVRASRARVRSLPMTGARPREEIEQHAEHVLGKVRAVDLGRRPTAGAGRGHRRLAAAACSCGTSSRSCRRGARARRRLAMISACRGLLIPSLGEIWVNAGEAPRRRLHAVHVVDDRAAAERLAGEDADRAVLRRREAAAVVELEVAGELELLEILLVAVLAHLEHEHLTCRPSRTRPRSRRRRRLSRRRRRRTASSAVSPETSSIVIVFGASSALGGALAGPG